MCVDPSLVMAADTRPSGMPALNTTGALHVFPASLEWATLTAGLLSAAVNHARATRDPSAASAGPLTGHPPICQPSLIVTGFDQAPPANRTTEMSRISESDRSRYATIAAWGVEMAAVGQQSQTRSSSSTSAPLPPA